MLIINADDWGQAPETTDEIVKCIDDGSVSTTSAMVYMVDSERASRLFPGMEIGLHLNFTTSFSAAGVPSALVEHQARVAQFLLRHRLARVAFHPGLTQSFEFVVRAQFDEFHRLYDTDPARIDGHHHFHLSTNVLLQRLLPAGTVVRRNFTFRPGERSRFNRGYRFIVDWLLARRHRLVDHYFALPAANENNDFHRLCEVAHHAVVEVGAHPIQPDERAGLRKLARTAELAGTTVATSAAVRDWARERFEHRS